MVRKLLRYEKVEECLYEDIEHDQVVLCIVKDGLDYRAVVVAAIEGLWWHPFTVWAIAKMNNVNKFELALMSLLTL